MLRHRSRRFVLALAASLLPLAAAHAAPLRVAVEGEYPPFSSTGAGGKLAGFDVDIAHALCAEMKTSCKLVKQQWDRMIPDLVAGRYEMIVSSMSITARRRQQIDFTEPYYQTPAKFVGRKGESLEGSLSQLKGKRVGVQKATTHEKFLTEQYGDQVQVARYDTLGKAASDLGAGQIDYLFGDAMALDAGLLRTAKGKGYAFVGPDVRDRRYFGEGIGIAVQKGATDLRARLNQALATLHANGTYDAIAEKYFAFGMKARAAVVAQP